MKRAAECGDFQQINIYLATTIIALPALIYIIFHLVASMLHALRHQTIEQLLSLLYTDSLFINIFYLTLFVNIGTDLYISFKEYLHFFNVFIILVLLCCF